MPSRGLVMPAKVVAVRGEIVGELVGEWHARHRSTVGSWLVELVRDDLATVGSDDLAD